jgi:hypothetical protein
MKAEISPSPEESKESNNKEKDPDEVEWAGFDRGYITKGNKSSKEEPQDDRPQLPLWKRIHYLGVVWALWICSLYTVFCVHLLGTLVPLTAAQLLFVYWIRKNKLVWFPFQRQFYTWLHTTSIYDIFFRKVEGKKNLPFYRALANLFAILGIIFLLLIFTNPILNLDEMMFTRGVFECYEELPDNNSCGDLLLTFRLEDGKLVQFLDLKMTKSELKDLEQTKGEAYEIWGEPKTFSMLPQCRKIPMISQIKGRGYQRLYHKEYGENAKWWSINLAIASFSLSGLLLLLIFLVNKRKD